MKTTKVALLFVLASLSLPVHAEEAVIVNKITPVPAEEVPRNRPGLFQEFAGESREHSKASIRLGYFLNSHFLLMAHYSNAIAEREASGGRLDTWNYVEEKWSAKSERYFLELAYFPFAMTVANHGPYVMAGLGQSRETLAYNYDRYKPYNGFVCWIGTCDRSTEESDGGRLEYTQNLATVGAGYLWNIFLGYPGLSLRAGANYLYQPARRTETFGRTRTGEVSSIRGNELALDLGVGITLPNWF